MTKRFTLQMDTEWWVVGDNTIKVNENGYREDLTGEDKYRGLKQELTEQEVVDLLNEQDQKIKAIEKLLDNELKKAFNNRINHDDYAEDAELAEYFKGYHCGVGDLEKKIRHILFNK